MAKKQRARPAHSDKVRGTVSITVHESNLIDTNGQPTYYGTIDHKKVTVTSILNEMEHYGNALASKQVLFYIAQELSRRMMEKLQLGYAIEMLEFGTLYPAMKGKINPNDTPSQLRQHFDVGFTPSQLAIDAITNLNIDMVHTVSTQHDIASVIDLYNKNLPPNTITRGKVARIKGHGIKLGGAVSGLYAVTVPQDFIPNKSNRDCIKQLPPRDTWIAIDSIITNVPSHVEFFTDPLSLGTYVFVLETSLSKSGKTLKKSVSVVSPVVTVV